MPQNPSAQSPGGVAPAIDNWVTVKSSNGPFTAKMPSTPKEEKHNMSLAGGELKTESYKVLQQGIVWNIWITAYPEATMVRFPNQPGPLERIAESNEELKPGFVRDYLKPIEGSKHESMEHRFHYSFGKDPKTGEPIQWFSIQRHTLVGNTDCNLFVDVQDAVYKKDQERFDKELAKFFDSLKVTEEASPPGN